MAKTYPVIGQPLPLEFLSDIDGIDKQFKLGEGKGKPFILDFFSVGCIGCFLSFPKVNEFQNMFGGEMQFLLIGKEHKLVRSYYNKYRDKYNLHIPVVYDSTLFLQFKITGVPYLVWVDHNGIVNAVTSSDALTEKNIRLFIEGRQFDFADISFDAVKTKRPLDFSKPFLTNGNGGDDDSAFLQRSLLSKWKFGMPFLGDDLREYVKNDWPLQVLGWPLVNLYRLAYFGKISTWLTQDTVFYGKYHYSPILEVADDSLFQFSGESVQRFCYSQVLPSWKRTPQNIQEVMKRDLKNFFGYDVSVAVKKMPYLRLVATEAAKRKLKANNNRPSKFDDSFGLNSNIGVSFANRPVRVLVGIISSRAGLVENDLPLIDETGILGNIDISFEAIMTDWLDVKMALQKLGLDMEYGEKAMKVLIISDPAAKL